MALNLRIRTTRDRKAWKDWKKNTTELIASLGAEIKIPNALNSI